MSKLVLKCPKCGTVQYVKGDGPCWKCHTMVVFPKDGVIQIYRMASCKGVFGRSMEIYLNGILFGLVEFNEVIRIPVPYGHYNVMMKFMDYKMSKYKGTALEFDITPNNRIVYLKAARVIPGYMTNTTILEPATAEEMPLV
ncbi:MAG: hypothetical protein IKQ44_08030 [Lachnospiraceae bacterium]|nr:hypothetical protein [Lachnospiraceae bacterium]